LLIILLDYDSDTQKLEMEMHLFASFIHFDKARFLFQYRVKQTKPITSFAPPTRKNTSAQAQPVDGFVVLFAIPASLKCIKRCFCRNLFRRQDVFD
jgi:hypothetical protein